ncbi:MAG: VanZ family protein [Peptacetobacter sp.]|nr:VanZ family protein [Peptacetobacter sp.]
MDFLIVLGVPLFGVPIGLFCLFLITCAIFLVLKIFFHDFHKIDAYILMGIYVAILIVGLLFRDVSIRGIEFNPLAFISDFQKDFRSIYPNLMNIFGFIPFYPILYAVNKTIIFKKGFTLFLFTSFIIEAMQYIFSVGFFSVADIVLYFIGMVIGYILIRIIEKN